MSGFWNMHLDKWYLTFWISKIAKSYRLRSALRLAWDRRRTASQESCGKAPRKRNVSNRFNNIRLPGNQKQNRTKFQRISLLKFMQITSNLRQINEIMSKWFNHSKSNLPRKRSNSYNTFTTALSSTCWIHGFVANVGRDVPSAASELLSRSWSTAESASHTSNSMSFSDEENDEKEPSDSWDQY